MPDQEAIDAIAATCSLAEKMLQSDGIIVWHEYQDFLRYDLRDDTGLTFGTINGCWQCQHYRDDGRQGNQDRCLGEELPLTATAEEIVAWVKRAIEHWNKAQ